MKHLIVSDQQISTLQLYLGAISITRCFNDASENWYNNIYRDRHYLSS